MANSKYAAKAAQERKERVNARARRNGEMPPPPHKLPKLKRKGGWRHKLKPF